MLDLPTCRLEFLADKRRKNLSPRTLSHYETATTKFVEFMEERAAKVVEPSHLRPAHVKAYLDALGERLSPGGVHARMRVLRVWMNWLVREELVEQSPMARLRLLRVPQRNLDVVTPTLFRRLVREAGETACPARNRAILHVLYDTGLRVSELVALQTEDLVANNLVDVVRGKGAKGRLVPMSRSAARALRAYMRSERKALPGVAEVFLSRTGAPITRSGVASMVRALCRRAGADPVGPHAFRRGFVVSFLTNEGDPFSAKRILGHTSLTMVDRYAALATEDLQAVHQRASPVAQLREQDHA